MPGNPITKARRVDDLVSWFDEWFADFERVLPPCYRYTGQESSRDDRGDAWRQADKQTILLRDALQKLQTALRSRIVTKSTISRGRKRYQVTSTTD